MSLSTLIFGALAVAAFWAAVRMCSHLKGKPWYGVAVRVVGTVVLIAFGVLMIFYAAFGARLAPTVTR